MCSLYIIMHESKRQCEKVLYECLFSVYENYQRVSLSYYTARSILVQFKMKGDEKYK